MKEREYVITGINRLTGKREEMSGHMSREHAEERLQRELASRKYQRFQPHTRLRVEVVEPVQLTFQFED